LGILDQKETLAFQFVTNSETRDGKRTRDLRKLGEGLVMVQ